MKKLQRKIGDSLEWILETISQEEEGESMTLRKRRALDSLAYARSVLKGSVPVVDDTRLFDEKTLGAQIEALEGVTTTGQGLPHISGYPPSPGSPPTAGLEARRIVTPSNDGSERRRSLGHSSSSPSLTDFSTRLSPALPRTPWTHFHDKTVNTHSSAGSTPPKPQQRSASSSSRPTQTEISAKPPIQHDPLGVL